MSRSILLCALLVNSVLGFVMLNDAPSCDEFSCRRKRDAPENIPVFSDDRNPLCNSPPLRQILKDAMVSNVNATFSMVTEKLDAKNYVIFCGPSKPYKFLVQMKNFCSHSTEEMSCAIFES